MRTIRQPDVPRQLIPVADLPRRMCVGLGVGRAAGHRVLMEILELCRQFLDDPVLA